MILFFLRCILFISLFLIYSCNNDGSVIYNVEDVEVPIVTDEDGFGCSSSSICYSLDDVFYDFNRNQTYSYKDASTVRDGSWYGCEPIWVTAEKNNIKSATYFWVGSEAKINNYRPSIYKYYKNGVDPIEKINEVISWLEYPKEEQPELITLYFNEPDHSGHVYGSEALNTLDEIAYADYLLGYLLSSLSSVGLVNAVNFIIVSDHGMVDVSVDRTINIDNIIDHDYKVYGKGPFLELHDGSYFNVKNTYTNRR